MPLIVPRSFINNPAAPAAGAVAPSFVKGNGGFSGSPTSSFPVSLASAVGVGNTVIIFVWYGFASPDITGLTDDKGNSYTGNVVGSVNDATTSWSCYAYVKTNVTNGPTTFTVTLNSDITNMLVEEYTAASGVSGTPVFAVQTSVATTANAIATGNTTTVDANCTIIGGTSNLQTTNSLVSAGSGFTARTNITTGNTVMAEDKPGATAGTYNMTATAATAGASWISGVFGLKP